MEGAHPWYLLVCIGVVTGYRRGQRGKGTEVDISIACDCFHVQGRVKDMVYGDFRLSTLGDIRTRKGV